MLISYVEVMKIYEISVISSKFCFIGYFEQFNTVLVLNCYFKIDIIVLYTFKKLSLFCFQQYATLKNPLTSRKLWHRPMLILLNVYQYVTVKTAQIFHTCILFTFLSLIS